MAVTIKRNNLGHMTAQRNTPAKVFRFTPEDRKKLEQLLNERVPQRKIAEQMGRSYDSIRTEIKRGGGIQNYSADRRIKQIEENETRRKKNVSIGLTVSHQITEMKAQIAEISRQIDGLIELIGEMAGKK